jgi:phage baseplate assembly protein W
MADNFDINSQSQVVNLGADILIKKGDLDITPTGDIGTVISTDNLQQAIKRRIFTPQGLLGRRILDPYVLYTVTDEYGNGAHRFLSEPLSASLLAQIKDSIIDCLAQEPRIEVIDVTPTIETNAEGLVFINLVAEYNIIGANTTDNLVINFNPNTGTIT